MIRRFKDYEQYEIQEQAQAERAFEAAKPLLESGLSRINTHLSSGKPVGLLAAKTGEMTKPEHEYKAMRSMVSHLRRLGYGPIVAQGRAKWGPEKSVVVPGITKQHLKDTGEKFGQQAVIHAKNNKAVQHNLSRSDHPGTEEEIGSAHYNTPNQFGITILKGLGFKQKPGDPDVPTKENMPTRSFTFKEGEDPEYVLEALLWPPIGMFNPSWTPVSAIEETMD